MVPNFRIIGQVKWFNNKAGYGFITMKQNDEEKDVFAHYSTIQVGDTQYKYLVEGEYVEFLLSNSTSSEHAYQATKVTGINGGKLMCETRQLKVRETRRPNSEGYTKVEHGRHKKVEKTHS